jgi:hypothetical protein
MIGKQQLTTNNNNNNNHKVLYIITTLSEYNTGSRATTKGQDRLGEILIPIMRDSVESMVGPPFDYQLDVFLICGYPLTAEREQSLRQALPPHVGFQFWDDAAPLGYDNHNSNNKDHATIIPNTRALARQHRYVIKDKFFDYDLFLAFEDDMRITGHHVQHYMDMSEELDRLRAQAPLDINDDKQQQSKQSNFYGPMTRQQLARVIPGFVRVEVLLNETEHGAQKQEQVLPIPLDYDFESQTDGSLQTHHVDPEICCHVHNMKQPNHLGRGTIPVAPPASDLIVWETNIKAFQLRQLPSSSSSSGSSNNNMLDWSVLMMGPGKHLNPKEHIGGYWSGREGAFGNQEKQPSGGDPTLIAQQGGWMATRDQIARMNSGLCMGSFLPPFDQPTYNADGQESMNVEYWSGSYQLFTGVRGGCNMQRIISMHPDHFSKHLLYHVANNKQRQLSTERMVRADHLFAQLNTIQKMAKTAKAAIEATAAKN